MVYTVNFRDWRPKPDILETQIGPISLIIKTSRAINNALEMK